MTGQTKRALLGRGFPTDLIEKIGRLGHTVAHLRTLSAKALRRDYTEDETRLIREKIHRAPIDEQVVAELLRLSNGVCCYCADGNATRPYQIHHIEEHSVGQDDSLENLMVVCPNHHQAIPRRGYSVEEQKRQRQKWYALAELERAYLARGLSYPHGSFEALVFDGRADVSELFSFGRVSSATAKAVSEHSVGSAALGQLQKDDFLLIVGASGSGKSTLAVGVAGSVPGNGARVYRYVRSPQSDNRQSLQEILTFLRAAVEPCVLIVDDINTWATNDDIESVAAAASPTVKVIATATRAVASGQEPESDVPFPFNRVFVSWELVKPFVSDYLKSHEPEVVAILQPYRKHAPVERLGLGPFDQSLGHLLRRYEGRAQSVWQFLFLLRAGWASVESDLAEMIADGRADVPVVYAAIEQIAGVERAVTPEEAARAAAGVGPGTGLPPPDPDWVRTLFDRLVGRRVMTKVRGSYTTVHRDWARAFICAALRNPKSRESTTGLLGQDFDLRTAAPRRLAALKSWLETESGGSEFVDEWAARQRREDWAGLVRTAAGISLAEAAFVASMMHRMRDGDDWRETVGDAFESNEEALVRIVRGATHEDWHHLQDLFGAISHARPELAARVIESWAPEAAAEALSLTHPDYYDSITWFLGASVWKHSREWCREVGRHLDWHALSANLTHVRRGKVETIHKLKEIFGRLEVPLKRSMLRRMADVMYNTLAGAEVSEIRFGHLFFEIEAFPDEMIRIASALDARRVASEISRTPPHRWRDLYTLSMFASRAGSTFPQDLVDHIDDGQLIDVVHRYAEAYPHLFIPLLWQLAYGRAERRRELAGKLYQSALAACRRSPTERDSILRAFADLDNELASNMARELGVEFPAPEPPDEDKNIDLNKPMYENFTEVKEVMERLRWLEASGEDYDVGRALHGTSGPNTSTGPNA